MILTELNLTLIHILPDIIHVHVYIRLDRKNMCLPLKTSTRMSSTILFVFVHFVTWLMLYTSLVYISAVTILKLYYNSVFLYFTIS